MSLVALIGRPNVGKSTLFNRLIGERKSIESAEPGTTRDRIYAQINRADKSITIADLAGLNDQGKQELDLQVKEQVEIAIGQADLIVMVVSAIDGILSEDEKIAEMLRRHNKPVVVVANKADNRMLELSSANFLTLGFPTLITISAIHNHGISNLLDQLWHDLPSDKPVQNSNRISVALIGRPNVGKSTLLNHYAGENRAVVSEIAGTTRDNVEITIPFKNKMICFLDTAGLKRSGQTSPGIEKFSALRAWAAIQESQITVLLLDASTGPVTGDARVAGAAIELNKGLIIAINKWDLFHDDDSEEKRSSFLAEVREQLEFVPWAPVIFISGQEGLNDHKLLELIHKIDLTRIKRLTAEQIANVINRAQTEHPHLPKIYRLEQLERNEPVFRLEINRPETWHFSFSRFIENLIREEETFNGSAIKVEVETHLKTNKRLDREGRPYRRDK